jgi:predicted HicB family RNase H-like nuclease
MKPGTKTVTLRIPKELHEAILKEADLEDRSVNNFIAYAVKMYIELKSDAKK